MRYFLLKCLSSSSTTVCKKKKRQNLPRQHSLTHVYFLLAPSIFILKLHHYIVYKKKDRIFHCILNIKNMGKIFTYCFLTRAEDRGKSLLVCAGGCLPTSVLTIYLVCRWELIYCIGFLLCSDFFFYMKFISLGI